MEKVVREKTYVYEALSHTVTVDEEGRGYCRACNAVIDKLMVHCEDCLLNCGKEDVCCRYFDLRDDDEGTLPLSGNQHYTDGLMKAGLTREFPYFVADDYGKTLFKGENIQTRHWTEDDLHLIERALQFAADAHKGGFRKGTGIPYIIHPVEVATIVAGLTDDAKTIAAAALHDVVEDTKYTIEDIAAEFGSRVATLVAHESEDKMRHIPAEESWRIRKERFLESLQDAPREAKMICLGDKLSNMKQTVITHREKGSAMWQAFHQKDEKIQEWYYRTVGEKLSEFSDTIYWKRYANYLDMVFGKSE
ncbi:MAG: HD domain-containing protein [Lachnospiraceae bacterium]|nr:HD domain-containing protein [Lachnospiraceae bacterium]